MLAAITLTLARVRAGNLTLSAQVSCPTVSPGGTAQITVMLPAPLGLTHGSFQIDLDPAVFGHITAVNVFSASGDQQGWASLQGLRANVVFGANSGTIGGLPNVPVAQITAPVLVTAATGALGSVAVTASSTWRDVSGKQYTMSFASPGVAVGPGMSIQNVVPGAGTLPAGTVVNINGNGFTNSTKLQLDGVVWSNLQFVNPQLLTITLGGAADLTGKLFALTNADHSSARYYFNMTPTSIQDDTSGGSGYWPIFPSVSYQTAETTSVYWWLENVTASPIDVIFSPVGPACTPCARQGERPAPDRKITIPSGGLYLASYNFFSDYPVTGAFLSASAPIRVLIGAAPHSLPSPDLASNGLSPRALNNLNNGCTPNVVDYRLGDEPPPPITCLLVRGTAPSAVLTAGTDDGNPWLHATIPRGSSTSTVTMDPSGLALGRHTGVITQALAGGSLGYSSIVTLNVHAAATIGYAGLSPSFNLGALAPFVATITSSSPSVPVTVSTSDSWISVTPTSGRTPLTITITAAPSAPPWGSGSVTIQGPGNTLTIPVGTYTSFSGFSVGGSSALFMAPAGSTALLSNSFGVSGPFTFTTTAESGGNWLSGVAAPPSATNNSTWQLNLTADPTGLTEGLYHGTVVITPAGSGATGQRPVTLSATLSIWGRSTPPPAVSPASLEVSLGQTLSAAPYLIASLAPLTVSTGSLLMPFAATYAADPAITLSGPASGTTPATLYSYVTALFPGTYHGAITITAPPGSSNSTVVPVTVNALPIPIIDAYGPKISAIVNAASLLPGPIAPGEIVSIFGLVYTPANATLGIGHDGTVNRSLYGVRVLFNGIPAPLLYLSVSQINAVVPYEIAGASAVTVQIDGGGVLSDRWSVPIAAVSPGIFSQDGTGAGNGAILNQDSSINSLQNPAAQGSIVQIFLTGEGQTNPPGVTGQVTQSDIKQPTQAVSVQIGGAVARVVSATTAPAEIAGLFQVNAILPAGAASGPSPVVVTIGGIRSQSTATVFVR